jgi:hypothetical protein
MTKKTKEEYELEELARKNEEEQAKTVIEMFINNDTEEIRGVVIELKKLSEDGPIKYWLSSNGFDPKRINDVWDNN